MKYLLLLLFPINLFSATFSYSGDWRAELGFFHELDVSKSTRGTVSGDYADPSSSNYSPTASGNSKAYWLQRFKLKPELLIYDNVRIKSEWLLLAGSALNSTSLGGGAGNIVAGRLAGNDNINAQIAIRRAWLEWSSDWGVFSAGRQPFHFGLGMSFNSGDGIWDYWGDTVDRFAYNLILGNMYFKVGFDVLAEGAVNYALDDENGFLIEIGYIQPEADMEMSFLWYMDYAPGNRRTHTYTVFQRKLFPKYDLSIGWEAAYRKGTMDDTENNGTEDKIQAFGLLLEMMWAPSNMELGFKTGFASGDDRAANDEYYGFHFNRAYKFAMLLFNEDLGIGGDSVHGSAGIGADFQDLGAFFIAPYFSYTFSDVLKLGTTIAYARTHRSRGRDKTLGVELDIDVTYLWRENLETGIRFGSFFPGKYFQGRAVAIGLMGCIAAKF